MLIYNHQFEFVGIDKKDLMTLGFSSLEELQTQCDDFADLFIKKPSYIYNFKNFKWILYILNSNSEHSKAIISAKDRAFAVDLSVDIMYLTDNPKESAYKITLRNLHQIDGEKIPTNIELIEEEEPEAIDLNEGETTQAMFLEQSATELQSDSDLTMSTSQDIPEAPLDIYDHTDFEETIEDQQLPILEEENTDFLDLLEEHPQDLQETAREQESKPMLGDYVSTAPSVKNPAESYLYDPEIAAHELGLPVDLIEEFIGDFIQQAHDFKNDLYNSLNGHDIDQLKSLSHKLKGVSANLRIEDAFDALSIINTSNDLNEIKTNLDYFYLIIAKLEGKELPVAQQPSGLVEPEEVVSSAEEEHPPVEFHDDEDLYANLLLDHELTGDLKDDEGSPELEASPMTTQMTADEEETFESSDIEIQESVLDYDKHQAANELGLDKELIEHLLSDYKEQVLSTLHKMQETLDDTNATRRLAISLKGVSDNLRLNQISMTLNTILSTDDRSTVREALASLEQYATQL